MCATRSTTCCFNLHMSGLLQSLKVRDLVADPHELVMDLVVDRPGFTTRSATGSCNGNWACGSLDFVN